MQTFLPLPDFERSAACLDGRRLMSQKKEAYQIVRVLTNLTLGWRRHPAVLMWRGHEFALIDYTLVMCDEAVRRGYKDSVAEKVWPLRFRAPQNKLLPYWFGDEKFHAAHRAVLLYKQLEFYRRYAWTESPAYNYVWPPDPVATGRYSFGGMTNT